MLHASAGELQSDKKGLKGSVVKHPPRFAVSMLLCNADANQRQEDSMLPARLLSKETNVCASSDY